MSQGKRDTSLTESKSMKRAALKWRKQIVYLSLGVMVLLGLAIGYLLMNKKEEPNTQPIYANSDVLTLSPENTNPENTNPVSTNKESEDNPKVSTPTNSPTISTPVLGSSTANPAPPSFDKSSFIQAANDFIGACLALYGQLNFSASDADLTIEAKLDKASLYSKDIAHNAIGMRSLINRANITSGEAVQLTDLADDTGAKLSNAVTFYEAWIDYDNKDITSYNFAEGVKQKGLLLLDQFRNQLNSF